MPQPFNTAYMTNQGMALLTRAQAGKCSIEFTKISTGNGLYTEDEKKPTAIQQMNNLKSIKNNYGLSEISVHSDNCVKVSSIITNQDPLTLEALVKEGYYINEIGLYAKERDGEESTEILYSLATSVDEHGDYMPPFNGFYPAQIIQDYYVTVDNSQSVTIKADIKALATMDQINKIQSNIDKHNSNFDIHVTAVQKEHWNNKADNVIATAERAGLMSGADKLKMDNLSAGAEVNQNAYSIVKAGGVAISANSKTAQVEFVAGSNVTITGDNANKRVTVTANLPGTMPPSAHNQSANTITAGTFAGNVVVPAGTDYTVSKLRNAKFSTTIPTALANGEICFVYE